MKPFEPRPVRFHGLREHAGWRLKLYSIAAGGAAIDWAAYQEGLAMAYASLPSPAVTPARPGVGFVIAHRGGSAWYIVLAWWDQENELPMRVFVCALGAEGVWRMAHASESICVWDLEVIWFEREAYVATVLASEGGGGVETYLSRHFERPAPGAAPATR
jgi:hypothetical protein